MLPSPMDYIPTTTLPREVAVLQTLAYVGWLTTEQMHALCFPSSVVATVRTVLRALEDAHWIYHVRWRIKAATKSHIWAITPVGFQVATHYGTTGASYYSADLGRPSTALEHTEWHIRLAVRTLVTRLVLEGRRAALLAQFSVLFPDFRSASFLGDTAGLPPDLVLAIVWSPNKTHAVTWLPWTANANYGAHTPATHYALFFDRISWSHLLDNQRTVQPSVRVVPITGDEQQEFGNMSPFTSVGEVYSWPLLEQNIGSLLQQTPPL